jgi:riboflavin kinase/FMN adenylyltransferase
VTVNGKTFAAATNIGVRPTFQSSTSAKRRIVEAHLLPTEQLPPPSDAAPTEPLNLYRSRLRVEFLARLRDERRFESVPELQNAIRADIAQTREIYDRVISNESA